MEYCIVHKQPNYMSFKIFTNPQVILFPRPSISIQKEYMHHEGSPIASIYKPLPEELFFLSGRKDSLVRYLSASLASTTYSAQYLPRCPAPFFFSAHLYTYMYCTCLWRYN